MLMFASGAFADSPGASGRFAILDVSYVFKNTESIKTEAEQLEKQMMQLQEYSQSQQQRMRGEAQTLQSLDPASSDYAAQEEKLAGLESSIKLELVRRRSALSDAETRLYYSHYQRMQQIVRQIAKYNNIDIVLRYDSEAMDIEDPDSVLRGIMKEVVHRADSIDLTQLVLQAMNQPQVATGSATNPTR